MTLEPNLLPLREEATRYPNFCLSLSTRLLHTLTNLFTRAAAQSTSNLVLSIGSGSGLLEAHLHALWSSTAHCDLQVHGVEVHTPENARPVNRYLPEANCSTVRGTSQLSPGLHVACALLFVYPRDPHLVVRYLQAAHGRGLDNTVQAVVWLGPRADYHVFASCLQSAPATGFGFGSVESIEGRGMAEYEMMAVVWRGTTRRSPS